MRIYAAPVQFLPFLKSVEDFQFNKKEEDKKREKEIAFDSEWN